MTWYKTKTTYTKTVYSYYEAVNREQAEQFALEDYHDDAANETLLISHAVRVAESEVPSGFRPVKL
jgi:hypothetical protein